MHKMQLFSYNGRAFQFRLVNLPDDVSQEITKMILDNGGEIVDIDGPLAINFTVPDNYVPGKVMYDVDFIKDCVRWEEIGDLYQYKLGPRKAYDGCIMSLFLHGSPSCIYRCVSDPFPQNNICSACGSRNTFEILDESDSPVLSQNCSDEWRVITSDISYKKGGSDGTECLKSVSKNHPSLLQDETEVSPKLKKLQRNDNASSQEASSIYETTENLINYSPNSNLSLTQATQDGIDELYTDNDSSTSIIVIQQTKEIEQLNSGSQRSVKRAVSHAKHKSDLDVSKIIHVSSDSQSDQSWNLEKGHTISRSDNRYKISNLPQVELIQLANTSAREPKSHAKDESKRKAAKDFLIAYKLESDEKEKKEFEETSVSNCIKNSLKSKRKNVTVGKKNEENQKSKFRARTNTKCNKDLRDSDEGQSSSLINPFFMSYIGTTKRSGVSSEKEESRRSNNGKDHGRRDCGEIKSETSRKGKRKPEKSLIKRDHFKSNLSSGSDIEVIAINDTNKKGKKRKKRKLYDLDDERTSLLPRPSTNLTADLNKPDDICISEISKIRSPIRIQKRKRKLPTFNKYSVDGNSTLKKDPESSEDSTGSLTDPEGIFSDEVHRVLRPRKALSNTSYAMLNDDSDDIQEAARIKNDKSRSKKNDSEDLDPTVSTSELEIRSSDDSEASHRIKVKVESNNASNCPVRFKLNINRDENGKPFQTNLNCEKWLTWAKHKIQNMAAPRMRNFAKWEQWHMLIFLIENDLIAHSKGLDVWNYMIQREDCGHRTRMSLNNHFLKSILPSIEEFRLPKDIEKKFLTLRNMKEH